MTSQADGGSSSSPRAATRPRIQVGPVTDGHYAALADFFHDSWGSNASAASVEADRREAARRNPVNPHESPPTVVATEDDRVIGYCSSLPLRLWCSGREHPAYWAKGLMVRPEFRNGPIGFHVLKELSRHIGIAAAVTVHPASKRLFSALGYRDLGAIPNFVHPISLRAMLTKLDVGVLGTQRLPPLVLSALHAMQRLRLAWLAGAVADVVLFTASSVRCAQQRLTISIGGMPSSSELDELWNSFRSTQRACAVRDGSTLIGRYGDASLYAVVSVRRAGRLTGVGIVRRPRDHGDERLRGLRVSALSDLIYEDSHAGRAVLNGITRLAKHLRADAILASVSAAAAVRLLRGHTYLRFAGNVHFFLRAPQGFEYPQDISDWWLTRGDGASDETF